MAETQEVRPWRDTHRAPQGTGHRRKVQIDVRCLRLRSREDSRFHNPSMEHLCLHLQIVLRLAPQIVISS